MSSLDPFNLYAVYALKQVLRMEMEFHRTFLSSTGRWQGGSGPNILGLLENMLKDETLDRSVHHAVIRTLLSPAMGSLGIDFLASFCSSVGYGDLVQDILTLIA